MLGTMRPLFAMAALVGALACACGGGGGAARAPIGCANDGVCGTSADGMCLAGTCTTRAELPGRGHTRVTMRPTAVAWIGEGAPPPSMTPLDGRGDAARARSLATLGGEGSSKLLLRYAWPPAGLPSGATTRIEAAYVVLTVVDAGAGIASDGPLVLRASRVVEPWDAASVTWLSQPRAFDVGARPSSAPRSTSVRTARVDVRAVLERSRGAELGTQGIAIESRGGPPLLVALTVLSPEAVADPGGAAPLAPPTLEVYLAP